MPISLLLRRLSIGCLILAGAIAGAAPARAADEPRVALVLGNGDYARLPKLRTARPDAKAVAETLRQAGFDVIDRQDADRRAMIEALKAFSRKLAGGVGLVFFSGHGAQLHGTSYLLPVDAAIGAADDLRYEGIELDDVLNRLDEPGLRLGMVVLDAAHALRPKQEASGERGLARARPSRGQVVVYAAAPGRLAAEANGPKGIFAEELLKAMAQPGSPVPGLFEDVSAAVAARTKGAQVPWVASAFRGEFAFFGAPAPVAPVAAAPAPAETGAKEPERKSGPVADGERGGGTPAYDSPWYAAETDPAAVGAGRSVWIGRTSSACGAVGHIVVENGRMTGTVTIKSRDFEFVDGESVSAAVSRVYYFGTGTMLGLKGVFPRFAFPGSNGLTCSGETMIFERE